MIRLRSLIVPSSVCTALTLASFAFGAHGAERPAASAPPAPAASAEPSPERYSVRLLLGVGKGDIGAAGRSALELQYWLAPRLSIGATANAQVQERSFGSPYESATYSSWLVGPIIALRSSPGPVYLFGSAAAGFARSDYRETSFVVPPPPSRGPSGPREEVLNGAGATLMAGLIGRMGVHELGATVALDVLSRPQTEKTRVPTVLTVNVVVGLALD